jgi:chemotaxis signal transduction protein
MNVVDDLIPHMRRVQSAERDLRDLSLLWQMIEAASAISCPEEAGSILPMLTQTRVRFSALQTRLVTQLAQESLGELRDDLASIAQCTIDILVRNLFERTADVGFLATDKTLVDFCSATPDKQAAGLAALRHRLSEYVAKYSVYDDVVLLSPDGRVLARLDVQARVERSGDTIVSKALSAQGYVEQFGHSDLASGEAPTLLYGHRITEPSGRPCGVLVLRFRQADELQQVFQDILGSQQQVALVLLDADNRVIASSDEIHVPLGAPMQTGTDGDLALTVYGGREYMSVTRRTAGYQGYQGPGGWRSHAMVSLLTAFRSRHVDAEGAESLSLDNVELARIAGEVDAINSDLRRVVWNGRLVAGTQEGGQARLKSVLTQVTAAGSRTRDRAAQAIRDLYRSSLGRTRQQAQDLSRMAADIMDRNLYERANDCRWWALSPVLRKHLEAPASAEGTAAINATLEHINGLYTVYSRLVVFDAQGLVRGASNEESAGPLVGSHVEPELLRAVEELHDSQRYAVTPFAASPLGDGQPTYVYLAAVRSPDGRQVVGGIAIVFNAAREFRAMLTDVLADSAGIAAFVDATGQVIACTEETWKPGDPFPLGKPGLQEYQGRYYAVASVKGSGYREFKRLDGYDNGASAIVALRLGGAERRRLALYDTMLQALPVRQRGPSQEYAMFQLGSGRYAVPAGAVIEARPRDGLVAAPVGARHVLGLLEVPDGRGSRVVPVLCGRQVFGVDHPARAGDGVVLVLAGSSAPGEPRHPIAGFMVDHVSTVLEVGQEHVQAAPSGLRQQSPALLGLMRVSGRSGQGVEQTMLVQLMDPEVIIGLVVPQRMVA